MKRKTLKSLCDEQGISYVNIMAYKRRHKDIKGNPDLIKSYMAMQADRLNRTHIVVGTSRVMNNGLTATVIDDLGCNRITVQFEDGAIRENIDKNTYRNGCVAHPSSVKIRNYAIKSIKGQTRIMNNGMYATVIEDKHANDITVQFEDGTVKEHTSRKQFRAGTIGNPKYHVILERKKRAIIGKRVKQSCGEYATVLSYDKTDMITVQFDNGDIIENVRLHYFLKGKIGNVKRGKISSVENLNRYAIKSIGTKINTYYGIATVVDGDEQGKVSVIFENTGERLDNVSIHLLRKGNFVVNEYKHHRVGESKQQNCGDIATIIAYRASDDIDVQFTNGVIRKHLDYAGFNSGYISNINKQQIIEDRKQSEVYNTCGIKMKIKEYKNAHDIVIVFEDGAEVKSSSYAAYKKGIISHPTLQCRTSGDLIKLNNAKYYTFKVLERTYKGELPSDVYYKCECSLCGYNGILTPSEMYKHRCLIEKEESKNEII